MLSNLYISVFNCKIERLFEIKIYLITTNNKIYQISKILKNKKKKKKKQMKYEWEKKHDR